MTRTEALRALGLDPTADSASVRRAYLARVKLHSPEKDPEGFKALRSAFEVARNSLAPAAVITQPNAQTALLEADSDRVNAVHDALASVREQI